jgi:pyruvate formate lyase activating enzyme
MTEKYPDDPVGYLHSIETGGTVDGPGIRYVAFLQGCPLRCLYCHNPDSWKLRAGRVLHASALVADALKYRVFMRRGGVTLSGGEPLVQADFVASVFSRLRACGVHTALDTSGIIPVEQCRAALDASDLVILDIKALDAELCRKLTGSDNRNALQMLAWLAEKQKPVWIRHVIVPGYTDQLEDIEALAAYLAPCRNIQRIDLLPFHQMALHKWDHLDTKYLLRDVEPPTPALMEAARAVMRRYSLPVSG